MQEFLTLDGVMQAPGGPDEDRADGFAYGGWTAPYFAAADAAAGAFMAEHLKPADLLLGRRTYEIFAAYWPHHADQWPGIEDVTKYVVSSTWTPELVAASGWSNSVLLRGLADVKALKEAAGSELKVIGSSVLARSLLAHDLVDEMVLMTFPVVLGPGKRIFADDAAPAAFVMTSGQVTPNGVTLAHYRKSGAVATGTVG